MATSIFNPLSMPLFGVHSISASAGTGKTYAITTLYLRYLLDPAANCSVDSVLVTTFTEAATAELKDRLRRRLKESLRLVDQCELVGDAESLASSGAADTVLVDLLGAAGAWEQSGRMRVRERIEDALLNFDQAPVFTIHGFCHRILNELVFETGSQFDAELVTSLQPLIDEAVTDFTARWWADTDSPLAGWLKLDAALWKSMQNVAKQALDNPDAVIVPDGDDLELLLASDLTAQLDNRLDALEAIWRTDQHAVRRLLVNAAESGVLNRNLYAATTIDKGMDCVRRLLVERSGIVLSASDTAAGRTQRRLTQSAINAGANQGRRSPQHHLFQQYENAVEFVEQLSRHRAELRTAMMARLARSVREHVAVRKRESGVMSFSDLLHDVDRALSGERNQFLLDALRDRYRVAMVDEFQDTDPVQYRIFRQIFMDGAPAARVGRGCVMIGDPKQSIYRFRGADIHACLQAFDETPQENRHQMDTNWRSDASLVDAVQAVFASTHGPFLNQRIGLPPISAHFPDRVSGGPAFSVTLVENPLATERDPESSKEHALQRVLPCVVDDIVTQLQSRLRIVGQDRTVEPQDVAVLCRTGRELRQLQQHLADRGVPSVLQTEESVFDSPEATALTLVLRAVLDTGSHARLATALQTSLFGFDASQLDELQHDERELSEWTTRLHRWRDVWARDGFAVMWTRLLEEQAVVPRLAGLITGERQITNYLHLGELLHNQAEFAAHRPDELLQWFEQMIAEPDRRADDQSQLRLETDAAAVQLCTIHKSKGLEYPIVYCPTLWSVRSEQFVPDTVLARLDAENEPVDPQELDVGSHLIERRREQDQNEQQAEDRRLLYVALTRAKHQCHVYWTAVRGAARSAFGHFMLQGAARLDDAGLASRIGSWLHQLGVGRVELRHASRSPGNRCLERFQSSDRSGEPLTCRTVTRPVIPSLVQTSFTALSRTGTAHQFDEVADRDAVSAQQISVEDVQSDRSSESTLPLAGLRGGRQLGDVVHKVFEDVLGPAELVGADIEAVRAAVLKHLEQGLQRQQIDDDWGEPLAASITASLMLPIAADPDGAVPSCSLLDIESRRLTCEMPFLMRLGHDRDGCHADAMAGAFEQSSCNWIRGYADRVRSMSASGLRGFLAGFIDLVFEHGGRWYVLDYKTNNLGSSSADYSADRLREAMIDHDYVLQYHLYTAALDSFLRQRIPDYSYTSHFGGVVYLFVRAVQPEADTLDGIFFDRPDESVVAALSAAIMGNLQPEAAR